MTGNRKFIAAIVTVLLLLFGLASVSTWIGNQRNSQEEWLPMPSVYNDRPSGIKAWHEILKRSGLGLRVWRKSHEEMETLPPHVTMVMIYPQVAVRTRGGYYSPFSRSNTRLLLQWVEQGNTLVLMDTFQGKIFSTLGNKLSITSYAPTVQPEARENRTEQNRIDTILRVMPGADAMLSAFIAKPIRTRATYRLKFKPGAQKHSVILADEKSRPVLVALPYGKGKIILGTAVDLISNRYLHDALYDMPESDTSAQKRPADEKQVLPPLKTKIPNDNFQFFTNLLSAEKQPVYIDEFVHGYGTLPDIFSYYAKTPLGKMFIQLILLMMILLWLSFRLWKPLRKQVSPEDGNQMKAYIESVGGLYQRSHAASLALAPHLAVIDDILRSRYRLDSSDMERLKPLLTGLLPGASAHQAAEVLIRVRGIVESSRALEASPSGRRVDARKSISETELLKLMQQLTLIQERLSYAKR